jgi:hypothetical protein
MDNGDLDVVRKDGVRPGHIQELRPGSRITRMRLLHPKHLLKRRRPNPSPSPSRWTMNKHDAKRAEPVTEPSTEAGRQMTQMTNVDGGQGEKIAIGAATEIEIATGTETGTATGGYRAQKGATSVTTADATRDSWRQHHEHRGGRRLQDEG